LQSGSEVGSIKIVGEKLSGAGALYPYFYAHPKGTESKQLIIDD
jgi:hypothetical protein